VAQKLTAAMPPGLDIPPATLIQITAVDATTGDTNTDVLVSNVSIIATTALPPEVDGGLQPLAPLFVPIAEP
jgi:hypothetical protein